MKSILTKMIVGIGLTALFVLSTALCGDARVALFPSENELLMIRLINEARQSPLEIAASFGKYPEQVLKDHPADADMLMQGLPPVATSQALTASAGIHVTEMLDARYYSKISPAGFSPLQRMEAEGYLAADGEEVLGMLAFRNFISPDAAVRQIFKNMFMDELAAGSTGRRCILDALVTDVGVSLKMSQWLIGGVSYNIYMVACDFGISAMNEAETTLMVLLNQARRFPLAVAQSMGMNPEEIVAGLPDMATQLSTGMAPVRLDARLYAAASDHGWEMLDMDYLSSESPDGSLPMDRVMRTGYPAAAVGELIRVYASATPIEAKLATAIDFKKLFARELDAGYTASRTILNPQLNDLGVRVLSQAPEASSEAGLGMFDRYYINLIVGDFAYKIDETVPTGVYGWAFRDTDTDGVYDAGEGIGKAKVTVYDVGGSVLTETYADPAGGFDIDLAPGDYRFDVTAGAFSVEQWVQVTGQRISVPVKF
jgi:uncharacterized protein YkwD